MSFLMEDNFEIYACKDTRDEVTTLAHILNKTLHLEEEPRANGLYYARVTERAAPADQPMQVIGHDIDDLYVSLFNLLINIRDGIRWIKNDRAMADMVREETEETNETVAELETLLADFSDDDEIDGLQHQIESAKASLKALTDFFEDYQKDQQTAN